jgi:hypothetical protein
MPMPTTKAILLAEMIFPTLWMRAASCCVIWVADMSRWVKQEAENRVKERKTSLDLLNQLAPVLVRGLSLASMHGLIGFIPLLPALSFEQVIRRGLRHPSHLSACMYSSELQLHFRNSYPSRGSTVSWHQIRKASLRCCTRGRRKGAALAAAGSDNASASLLSHSPPPL